MKLIDCWFNPGGNLTKLIANILIVIVGNITLFLCE